MEEEKETTEKQPVKSKMSKGKKLLIIGIGLFFVAQIGVSYLIISSIIMPMKELQAKGESPKPPEKKEEEEPVSLGFIFPLEGIIVNPANSNGMRYFKISLALEVVEEEQLKELEERKPLLLDITITALSNKTIMDLDSPDGKSVLKRELLDLFNKKFGGIKIRQLYFTEFVLQ